MGNLSNSFDLGADRLTAQYNRIADYISVTKSSCKDILDSLNDQLSAVKKIRDGLGGATNNTHIGAPQCGEALDIVIKDLTEAINQLSSL